MAGDSWPSISNIKTGGSGYGKTNALLNLANNKSDTDEIYLHRNNPFKTKYQLC